MSSKSLAELTLHAIGGGWGDEQPGPGKVRVAVIRGTDIPRLRMGDSSSVPVRFESEVKVKNRLLQVGDIVIEVSGGSAASGQHTGRSLLITTELLQLLGGVVIPASFCRLLRLDAKEVDPGFVVRQIDALHQTGEIAEFENQSTGIANFQFTRFVASTHPCIDGLASQQAINDCLTSFDQQIALNRRINQTLEAMAQAIFKSWFVDFDPVKAKVAAKAEGRDPLRAAMSAISGKTVAELDALPPEQRAQLAAKAVLFPDEMEESELGEIPKGWSVCGVPDCIEVNPSRTLKKGALAPYLDMANVPTHAARVDNVVLRAFGSGSKFANGDTLLARITPCLENGKTAYVDFLDEGQVGWGSTEFIVLRPRAGLPLPFAYFLCRHPEFRSFAISQMAGTSGRQRVPNDCFGAYRLAKPSPGVATAFGEQVTLFMRQIKAQDEGSKTLAEVRDALLPRLLSGELQVRNIDSEAAA